MTVEERLKRRLEMAAGKLARVKLELMAAQNHFDELVRQAQEDADRPVAAKKDSNGAIYCKCGHPEWAHRKDEGSRSAAGTWFDGEIMECNWDIDKKCGCRRFKGDWGS